MSKIIITADVHNGVPGRINDTVWAMEVIREYAKDNSIEDVLVLGDLFHDRVNLNIEVFSRVYDFLHSCKTLGQKWFTFPGNHDMYYKNTWEVNAIHQLKEVMYLAEEITTFEVKGQTFHILPFMHSEKEYMKELKKIDERASEDDILLTHIGVNSATMNFCFLIQNWNDVTFDSTKFKRIYTGHFHCQQQVGEKTWYPGSPIAFRFDEGEVEHGFFVYDIESNSHEFIKIYEAGAKYLPDYRPADFITILDEDIDELSEGLVGNNVKLIMTQDYTGGELLALKNRVLELGAVSVKCREKQDKTKAEDINDQIRPESTGTPQEMFKLWVEHDKPNWIKPKVLFACFDSIVEEAEEKYTLEPEND